MTAQSKSYEPFPYERSPTSDVRQERNDLSAVSGDLQRDRGRERETERERERQRQRQRQKREGERVKAERETYTYLWIDGVREAPEEKEGGL